MEKVLITGGAGFVGAALAADLQRRGVSVVVVDRISDYYDVRRKRERLAALEQAGVVVVETDIVGGGIAPLLDGVDVVFHLAGQPGVRSSWSDEFATYAHDNVVATQVLLEAVVRSDVRRVVYASSSSVYGDNPEFPFTESSLPMPRSPYGVTKLAGEHLVNLYAASYGISTVSLRYFTVYGPDQRPDMAMHRLVEAALTGQPFPLNGDGEQVRDFTFVRDVVEANVRSATVDAGPGTVLNIAGGSTVSMNEVIAAIERLSDRRIAIERKGDQAGDVRRTGADRARAEQVLGWVPAVGLEEGLSQQIAWHAGRHGVGLP